MFHEAPFSKMMHPNGVVLTKISPLLQPNAHFHSFDHQNFVTFHTKGDFASSGPKMLRD